MGVGPLEEGLELLAQDTSKEKQSWLFVIPCKALDHHWVRPSGRKKGLLAERKAA
jgi:hypothetical protein